MSSDPKERSNFDEIFFKFSNKDKKGEYIIIEDADLPSSLMIMLKNISEITDPTEKLLDKIRDVEEGKKNLKKKMQSLDKILLNYNLQMNNLKKEKLQITEGKLFEIQISVVSFLLKKKKCFVIKMKQLIKFQLKEKKKNVF